MTGEFDGPKAPAVKPQSAPVPPPGPAPFDADAT
jgi:hypothetical protein